MEAMDKIIPSSQGEGATAPVFCKKKEREKHPVNYAGAGLAAIWYNRLFLFWHVELSFPDYRSREWRRHPWKMDYHHHHHHYFPSPPPSSIFSLRHQHHPHTQTEDVLSAKTFQVRYTCSWCWVMTSPVVARFIFCQSL